MVLIVLFDGLAANRARFVPANPFDVLVATQAQMMAAIGFATSGLTAASKARAVIHFHSFALKELPTLALAGVFDKSC